MTRTRTALAGMAIAAVSLTGLAAPAAQAQDGELFIPLLTYRTGPFAGSGIPIADTQSDTSTVRATPIVFVACRTLIG